MTQQDLIFSALMGHQSVKMIERLNLVQNELSKHVLLQIPFLPFQSADTIERSSVSPTWQINQTDDFIEESKQFFPLSFSFSDQGTKWTFPFEPMINISGGNSITKKNVSKKGIDKKGNALTGTMKTRMFRKDYEIIISGTLIGKQLTGKPEDCYPIKQMQELMKYLVSAGSLFVYSHPLEILGINHIVIEDYSFPFTKGENVQAYEIKAISDFPHSLTIKENF